MNINTDLPRTYVCVLSEFMADATVQERADVLNVSKSAVSKWLNSNRKIHVYSVPTDGGQVAYFAEETVKRVL